MYEHEQKWAISFCCVVYVLLLLLLKSFLFLFSWWTSCQKLFSKKFHNHFSFAVHTPHSFFFSGCCCVVVVAACTQTTNSTPSSLSLSPTARYMFILDCWIAIIVVGWINVEWIILSLHVYRLSAPLIHIIHCRRLHCLASPLINQLFDIVDERWN